MHRLSRSRDTHDEIKRPGSVLRRVEQPRQTGLGLVRRELNDQRLFVDQSCAFGFVDRTKWLLGVKQRKLAFEPRTAHVAARPRQQFEHRTVAAAAPPRSILASARRTSGSESRLSAETWSRVSSPCAP